MQIAVFQLNNNVFYAIDVFNIIAFIINKDTNINPMPTDIKTISGIATIRGEPVVVLNLDYWMDENLDPNSLEYNLIIYSKFKDKEYGFLIKNMIGIYEVTDKEMGVIENPKIKNTLYINVNNQKELCLLLNFEEFLKTIKKI